MNRTGERLWLLAVTSVVAMLAAMTCGGQRRRWGQRIAREA